MGKIIIIALDIWEYNNNFKKKILNNLNGWSIDLN